ncbi:MAG: hypothetical protein NT075_24085 [Chloroflexi bacterium]|nr:hypothetical protein [Chloroflexota bacterium]
MSVDFAELTLPRAYANLLRFYRQSEQKLGRIEQFYAIAGYTVCLRFAGQALVPQLTSALSHLATTPTSLPDLVVCLADQQSSGIAMPPAAWAPGMYSTAQARLYFHLNEQDQRQESFMPRFRLGLFAIADSALYPPNAQAAPLRHILVWWLAQQGLYGLHVAAVGNAEGAVLIVGSGGAGKSTTAIACLQAGFTYIGDDFCVLGFDPAPRIHSLYSSGKLRDDSRQWLKPHEAAARELGGKGKMIYQWHTQFKSQLPRSLPIRAILLPRISGATATTARSASPGEAFTALTTTTLRVLSLPAPAVSRVVGAISRLTRQVPCYHLALGSETTQIPGGISSILEQHRP